MSHQSEPNDRITHWIFVFNAGAKTPGTSQVPPYAHITGTTGVCSMSRTLCFLLLIPFLFNCLASFGLDFSGVPAYAYNTYNANSDQGRSAGRRGRGSADVLRATMGVANYVFKQTWTQIYVRFHLTVFIHLDIKLNVAIISRLPRVLLEGHCPHTFLCCSSKF